MADHEDDLRGYGCEAGKRPRVAHRGLIEALTAGKRIAARVRALPRPVLRVGPAVELTDVDVVQQRLLAQRNLAIFKDDRHRLASALKARVDTQVDRELRQLE